MSSTLMQVIVRTLTGNQIRIGVEPSDPVLEVKRLVEERVGVPIDQQRLVFAGKLIEDHRSLAYYRITEDCNIHVVLALRNFDPSKTWNVYIDSKPILTEMVSSPIVLQYTSANPSITKIDSRIASQCKNYQELFLRLWYENHRMYPESSAKTSEKRIDKYTKILRNIYKWSVQLYGEPLKGWKSDARKVLPVVLAKCGYSEAEIELVKDTKLFDIVDAVKFIEQRRIELITTPASELAQLFFNQHDVVFGSLMPHLSLCDRMHFSNTCKEFNSMARQPIVWRHLCLLHDRARVRDKHFVNILQQYGSYIQALSVQKCLGLTEISLMLIGDKCPNLRVLNAADNPFFDHDEQNAVFDKAIKLQVINLSLTSPYPLPKPIGRIDVLKGLKELNISGRRQPKDTSITHETLKVLDIRGSTTQGSALNIDCPQLQVLFVDQPHSHPKHTMQRTAKIYTSHGASDPQSFEGKESNSSDQLDEYYVINS